MSSTATAAKRATAVVRSQGRRRRIATFTLIVITSIVVLTGWFIYNQVLSTINKTLNTIIRVMPTPEAFEFNPEGTPIRREFPDWREKEPINILLLGLDERRADDGTLLEVETRADTQIIVHIDPRNKTAAMVAIPRDLYVEIPGYGNWRINSAYQFGERDKDKVPGGGPGLARVTIKENFGIRIDYYARVNFKGFERIIDALGGVTLDVARPLVDNDYPLPNYGTTRIYIPAGIQHMDGKTALQYARSRHADSDLGRNYRQQQVLLAVRQQGLQLISNLDILIKINDIAEQVEDAVVTDLQIEQVAALAQIAQEIGPEGIETLVIEPPMLYEDIIGGAAVLVPNWSMIRPKIAELFADPKVAREKPIVLVLNGTFTNGMAANAQAALTEKGIPVTAIGSAPEQGSFGTTVVTDYTGGTKPDTLAAILKTLDLDNLDVTKVDTPEWAINSNGQAVPIGQRPPNGSTPVDFVVTIGNDLVAALVTPTPVP
jgi:LCP family protein required for cell wall assembly